MADVGYAESKWDGRFVVNERSRWEDGFWCLLWVLGVGLVSWKAGIFGTLPSSRPAQKQAHVVPGQGRSLALQKRSHLVRKPMVQASSATVPKSVEFVWDQAQAEKFVQLSLHCTVTEFPYKLGQVLSASGDLKAPRMLHPAFYGCFDWHSAVHGHWSLVRLLRKFPQMSVAPKIRAVLQRHLTAANLQQETAFFQGKYHKTFERPYGYGWFLRLVAELHTWKEDKKAQQWRAHLRPLETLLVERTVAYLKKLSVPVRSGTHSSTAYALIHIFDYADATGAMKLRKAVVEASQRFYGNDTLCPTAYEPSGEDFVSPCLAEADLMRRVLTKDAFASWLSKLIPSLEADEFQSVREPPRVLDRKDYKIGHLIGLAWQRAAAMRGIASRLASKDPRRDAFLTLAQNHRKSAIHQMFSSGYGGTHWLASFAIYDLTQVGILP